MMLDVNMGVPLADEAELLARAVRMVQGLTDLPLCIDSSVVEALDAGLAAYQGKALVNSVTGEAERLEAILPLVKRYGAAVIALPNEEDEIPEDPPKRLEITRKIIDIAVGQYEIPIEDIVIDPLAMPVGADSTLVRKTLRHDRADPRGVRREHDARRRRTCRSACRSATRSAPRSCRWRCTCGLTSAIMDARTPEHRRGGQGGGPDAGQRRVGGELDRGAPGEAGRR